MSNKRGFSPSVLQDLRREFRLRSAAKKQQANSRGSKPSSRSTPVRRKSSKHISTSSIHEKNSTLREKKAKCHQLAAADDTTTSKYHPGSADKISAEDEDPPTEFEIIPNAKPAKFAREWHKFSLPLDQLSSKASAKKRSKSCEKKKDKKKVPSHRRKSSTANNTPIVDENSKKIKKESKGISSKKISGSGRKRASEPPKRTERRKSPVQISSQHKETKAVDAKPSREKLKHSGEAIEEAPLVSLDEEDEDKTVRTARQNPKFVPTKKSDFKLKPYTDKVALSPTPTSSPLPATSPSSATSTTKIEEEISALDHDDVIERSPQPKTIETDRCSEAVVIAANRIIDYCDEKDLFKEFIDPSDLPTFNSFLIGEVKSMPDLLTILENLMDQIVESKKLSETEAIAKDWIIISKNRIDGRNYLLDSFLSKKTKVNISDQGLTSKSTSTVPSQNTPSTSPATSSSIGRRESEAPSTTQNTPTDATQRTIDNEEKNNKNA